MNRGKGRRNMEEVQEKVERTTHPEIQKILDFPLPKGKVRSDLLDDNGELKIGDLIDDKGDIYYDPDTGKPMVNHSGILAIWEGIGAELLKPELEKTGDFEYHVVQGIRFADGTVFYSTGEAGNRNIDKNSLSGKFPVNQAHVRAINKAMVRGLGLYRMLLTEEEAEEFKLSKVKEAEKRSLERMNNLKVAHQNEMSKMKQKYSNMMKGMMRWMALSGEDEKYPNAYIWDVRHDEEYMKKLSESEDYSLAFVAKNCAAAYRQEQLEKQKEEELNKADESDNDGGSNTEENHEEVEGAEEKIGQKEEENHDGNDLSEDNSDHNE